MRRHRGRRLIAVLLASGLLQPGDALRAQETASPPDAAGSWEGWAKLTSEWNGSVCRYETDPPAVAVRLELRGDSGTLQGSLALDIAAAAGSSCPPLRKRYTVAEVAQGPATLAFTDSGGNEWTLALRRSATVLQGLLAWREGGPDEPLAEGYSLPDGKRPLARLSGEVRLERAAVATAESAAAPSKPAEAGTTASPPRKAGAGTAVRHLGVVLGANVVGLAALYGANRLGRGSTAQGAVTCSPHRCIVGAPNTACYCEGVVLSGEPCGSEPGATGLQIGEPGCDVLAGRPCAAGLSCNNDGGSTKCEDQSGRCPW